MLKSNFRLLVISSQWETAIDSDIRDVDELEMTPSDEFRTNVFNVFLDCIIGNIARRFNAAKEIDSLFNVLWLFHNLNDEEIQKKSEKLQKVYENNIDHNLGEEILHLKSIYDANIQNKSLSPIELLNIIKKMKLDVLFPNIIIAIRLFCTIPVTVAEAERSFSVLKRIKDVLRSTMSQHRLNDLGMLSIESEMAKKIDFQDVINLFARRKVRKATF